MWNVECARCGDTIHAEHKDDILTDENGDPRHEECEYADKPVFPFEHTVRVTKYPRDEQLVTDIFPHLTPRVENGDMFEFPECIRDIGSHSITYRLTVSDSKDASAWGVTAEAIAVDGNRLATQLPRIVYECTSCGERVDGKVQYCDSGYRPFIHQSCSEGKGQFKPIEISHLDRTSPESIEDDILQEYLAKYNEL